MRVLVAVLVAAAAFPAAAAADAPVFEGPVPRAHCGPGSVPEVGLQGEVPISERDSPREIDGYRCNLEVVGHYAGEGASWQDTWYRTCGYYDTKFLGGQQSNGVQVLDVSDPTHPKLTANLTSVAMLDPWESLSVNPKRGLLAGVAVDRPNSGVGGLSGAGFFDVYDVSGDCAHPVQKASFPANGLGHEGEWAPDGNTYYATSIIPGIVTAIDVTDPSNPRTITSMPIAPSAHGLSVSDDGKRLYLATIAGTTGGNGLTILDVSDIQNRVSFPQIRTVGSVFWSDGSTAQMTIPVKIGGHPYVIETDEGTNGGVRVIDIGDETKPRVISKLKLEIQMPANEDRAGESGSYKIGNGREGTFAYNAHYCGVPQRDEPGVVGCSEFEAGVRIFDIRDPYHPREIAYLNPGGNGTQPVAGSHRSGGTSSYTSARVRFIPERGEIWFTDQDKGFYVARFTNGAWPFAPDAGAPASRCRTQLTVTVRRLVGRRVRRATVRVGGRRIPVRGGRVRLQGLTGSRVRLTVTAVLRSGRRVRVARTLKLC